jgi:glycosyltransferase involved in cell wall biosynthesis
MKVLFLTKYSRMGASSRLRSYQYFPFLISNSVDVTVSPLFNDNYLTNIYAGRKNIKDIFLSYFKRFLILFTLFKYEVVLIEYELFPFLPAWGERLMKLFGVKYIVDYDDAIFHNYDLSKSFLIKNLLGNKIDIVMKLSNAVIVGNEYLEQRAIRSGSKRIYVIPTVIDTHNYHINDTHNKGSFMIGWIGSPSTFKYLLSLRNAIEKLNYNYNITIIHIGSNRLLNWPLIKEEQIDWTEQSEINSIRRFDVGVMPLFDTKWEKGKCSFKLIQYMGCSLPVVASAIGMNKQVVTINNGFLVNSMEEWYIALERYILDKNLRLIHGKNGRRIVELNYSLEKMQQIHLNIIQEVVKG